MKLAPKSENQKGQGPLPHGGSYTVQWAESSNNFHPLSSGQGSGFTYVFLCVRVCSNKFTNINFPKGVDIFESGYICSFFFF